MHIFEIIIWQSILCRLTLNKKNLSLFDNNMAVGYFL